MPTTISTPLSGAIKKARQPLRLLFHLLLGSRLALRIRIGRDGAIRGEETAIGFGFETESLEVLVDLWAYRVSSASARSDLEARMDTKRKGRDTRRKENTYQIVRLKVALSPRQDVDVEMWNALALRMQTNIERRCQ